MVPLIQRLRVADRRRDAGGGEAAHGLGSGRGAAGVSGLVMLAGGRPGTGGDRCGVQESGGVAVEAWVPAAGACSREGMEGDAGVVELGLRAALRDVSREEIGFEPGGVPDVLRVCLPLSLVVPQLASGRVEVGIDDVVCGVPGRIRPAFVRAIPGLRIRIPLSELFHNLPPHVRPGLNPEPAPVFVRQFPTPFSVKAGEDRTRILPPAPAPPDGGGGMMAGRRGVLSRPPRRGLTPVPPLPAVTARSAGFRRPPGNGSRTPPRAPLPPFFPDEDGEDLGEAHSAADLQAEPPPDVLVARAPVRTPAASAGVPAADGGGFADGMVSIEIRGDGRLLALQALFPSEHALTVKHVAERCAGLPGIHECVLVTGGEVVGSAPRETEFQETIRRTIDSLRSFAASFGLSGGGSFTVRSDGGVRSFFLEDGTCVAVLHGEAAFPPGVREALTLTARELGALASGN